MKATYMTRATTSECPKLIAVGVPTTIITTDYTYTCTYNPCSISTYIYNTNFIPDLINTFTMTSNFTSTSTSTHTPTSTSFST